MTDREVSITFLGRIKFARAVSRSHLLKIFNTLNVVFSRQLTCSKHILPCSHSDKRCQLTPWAKFYRVSFMLRAHLSQWKLLTQLICHRNVCFLHRWLIFLDPCGFNPPYNLKSEQSMLFLCRITYLTYCAQLCCEHTVLPQFKESFILTLL